MEGNLLISTVKGRIIQAVMLHAFFAFFIIINGQVKGEQPMTVYKAPIGENITLPCPAILTSELLILSWRRNGETILSLNVPKMYLIPTADKYGLTGNTSLLITNISQSDAANYTCTARLGDDFYDSAPMQLFVTELLISHCPETQDSGDDVDDCNCHIDGDSTSNLTCSALGFPYEPVVSWKLANRLSLGSSVVNLTSYSNKLTLVCLAEDPILRDRPLSSKRVCVFYQQETRADVPAQQIGSHHCAAEPNKPLMWVEFIVIFVILIILLSATFITGVILVLKEKSRSQEENKQSKWVSSLVTLVQLVTTFVILIFFITEPNVQSWRTYVVIIVLLTAAVSVSVILRKSCFNDSSRLFGFCFRKRTDIGGRNSEQPYELGDCIT